jgi:hypothetical protein
MEREIEVNDNWRKKKPNSKCLNQINYI